MEPHLLKIKMLLNLATSPEPNEAANAAAMALKLIEKFGVTEEQLKQIGESDKPMYTDENLFVEVPFPEDWLKTLAIVVAAKFDCYAIQEENVLTTGEKTYKYFVYGEDTDVAISKQLFEFVYAELTKLIANHCDHRGRLYRDSFAEGAVNGIRVNIEYEDFAVKGTVVAKEKPETKPDAIETTEKTPTKPPAIEEKIQVNGSDKPIDIMAYFLGEGWGRSIHIGEIKPGKELALTEDIVDASLLANLLID